MSQSETTFSLEYILSVTVALGASYMINANSPNFSPVISFFIVPLLTAFVSLKIFSYLFPKMNTVGSNTANYLEYNSLDVLSNMGYMQVFPPLFAVLILVVIMLYNRNLG